MTCISRPSCLAVLIGLGASLALPGDGMAQERQEYVSTAAVTPLLKETLHAIEGKEATVLHILFPRGWIGERHYHTGDVFVYVLKGMFTLDIDGKGRQTLAPGQVYHEQVNQIMQARNASADQDTEIVLFQVGDPGEPLMIRAE